MSNETDRAVVIPADIMQAIDICVSYVVLEHYRWLPAAPAPPDYLAAADKVRQWLDCLKSDSWVST